MSTRDLLLRHAQSHPSLGVRDVFKFIHQSTYGCEHLVSSREQAVAYICAEAAQMTAPHAKEPIEPLDGAYSRVHLSVLNEGMSPETLGTLFYLSAAAQALRCRRQAVN